MQNTRRPASCLRCGDTRLHGWGKTSSGRQRRRCLGCGRASCETSGTALAGLHHPDKLLALLTDMLAGGPRSCRALAAELGVGKNTIWRWRTRILTALRAIDAPAAIAAPATTAHVVRESRKASREWVRHRSHPGIWPAPDRPRWVDVDRGRAPEPMPRAAYRLAVTIIQRRQDGRPQALMPSPGPGSAWRGTTAPHRCDGVPPTAAIARCQLPEAQGGDADLAAPSSLCRSTPTTEPLARRFRRFLRPFRGPATKHLAGYIAWFNERQRAAPGRAIEAAWAMLRLRRPTGLGDMQRAPP